ncbi:PREDICTED: uncharacterized protein LOC107333149 [Acropora digitifera]|uniref:uncharacterized protein LOC107333149 n=1 Tax=Acropora digitifera TaxID=70779 RepID=UPI00077A2654|nr:PREDICTED: uncharacterized protein LOC107333149 [Acropora digitifera]
MARIFRRAANKVMYSRDGHESIGLLISDEKVVYESFQKIVMAQVDESISLLKWAKSEENLALQDVFSKAFEVSCMWTSSWRDFNHEYYKYRKTFKEVLREERVLDEERRRQAIHTTKLNRLQKQLEQTKRKGDTGRCCSMANEILEILEVVSQAEKVQAELEVKATKLEMVKAEKLRGSMLQISDGLNQWASKTLLVAEAYSKLANLIPDTPTQLSESKIFHGTSESRNIVNNLARDLMIDPELSQQLKDMSHSAQCNLYAVSTPILPAQQNGVRCNHVGLNGEKMPGKVNRKPVGQRGISPQALCHHHLRAKKMDPNFGRPLSVPDLRPAPISPPPPPPKEAPAQTASKMLPPEDNSNVQWLHSSANISSDSDSDWEELAYEKLYSDSGLAQRKNLWKAASDGAINTAVGRVYEDRDAAMCQRTEKQSEEDFWNDNDSAAYVDFTGDVERMMQPNEIVIPNAPAQTTSKMLPENNNNIQWYASANISSDSDSDWEELGYEKPYKKAASDGVINTVGRVYEDKDSAMCQHTEKKSEKDLSHDDDSAAYVDFTDDVERCSPVYVDLINDGGESALYVELINDTETTMLSEEVLLKVNESAT